LDERGVAEKDENGRKNEEADAPAEGVAVQELLARQSTSFYLAGPVEVIQNKQQHAPYYLRAVSDKVHKVVRRPIFISVKTQELGVV